MNINKEKQAEAMNCLDKPKKFTYSPPPLDFETGISK